MTIIRDFLYDLTIGKIRLIHTLRHAYIYIRVIRKF